MVGKICNLPISCPCGSEFDIQHSMSCKKDGFIYILHNDLRDLTVNMMSVVWENTEIEPKLTPLSGEELQGRTVIVLSQQVLAAMPCYEWTGKETSLQWKNPSNRSWNIYTSSVFS